MAGSKFSITFNNEISECLAGLAKIRSKSIRELTEELIQEAIENEEDKILIERAAELNVLGAETVDLKDVKWD
jgi:predicted DNA-binding protein